jgi:hypothetical protein
MDIVAFYQDATQNAGEEDAVWKKFGGNKAITAPLESNAMENLPIVNARPGEGVYEKPVSKSMRGMNNNCLDTDFCVFPFLSPSESGACSSWNWQWSDGVQYIQEVDSASPD